MDLDLMGARLYGGTPAPAAPAQAAPAAAPPANAPAAAAALAPSPAPAAARAGPPAVQEEQRIAAALYPEKTLPALDVPEGIRKLREADAADDPIGTRLYAAPVPHSDLKAAFKAIHPDDSPMAEAQAIEHMRIAQDVGATAPEIVLAVSTIRRLAAEPLTIEQEETQRAQAFTALDEAFGKDQAPRALELARALAKRDPRLLHQLDASGAGNDPRVVVEMARLAIREHARGRLGGKAS